MFCRKVRVSKCNPYLYVKLKRIKKTILCVRFCLNVAAVLWWEFLVGGCWMRHQTLLSVLNNNLHCSLIYIWPQARSVMEKCRRAKSCNANPTRQHFALPRRSLSTSNIFQRLNKSCSSMDQAQAAGIPGESSNTNQGISKDDIICQKCSDIVHGGEIEKYK